MANPFLNIPDWLSWDNQGAGIAVSDLSNNGQQALIVLMVDSAAGKNKGLYRVGKNLDVKGTSSGDWGDWIEIPDWFSFENQGAGVALADLDGDGRPELVVFMIDNPEGKTRVTTASARRSMPRAMSPAVGDHGSLCPTGFRGRTSTAISRWPTWTMTAGRS